MVDRIEEWLENLLGAVLLLVFAARGAVLYGLHDPTFGLKLLSLAEILGYVGAIVVSTSATEIGRGVYVHRRFQKVGDLRAFPLGIVIAVVFNVFSRVSHFEPGYVFGILAAIVFRVKPTGEEDGRSITLASLWLLGLAAAGWFAFGPGNSAVVAGDHNFLVLASESLLSYVWTCGLQSLFFVSGGAAGIFWPYAHPRYGRGGVRPVAVTVPAATGSEGAIGSPGTGEAPGTHGS